MHKKHLPEEHHGERRTPEPAYYIASVGRAFELVRLLNSEGRLTVTSAADQLCVSASTAHRLLQMLVHHGLASRGPHRVYVRATVARTLGQRSQSGGSDKMHGSMQPSVHETPRSQFGSRLPEFRRKFVLPTNASTYGRAMQPFALQREQVLARWEGYTAAFTGDDPSALDEYVAEDVVFVRGNGMAPWRSRAEFAAFHGTGLFREYCEESLAPVDIDFLHFPTGDAYELCYFVGTVDIRVVAVKDWPDPPFGYPTMTRGDEYALRDRLIYAMDAAGMIVAILAMESHPLNEVPSDR